MSSQSSRMLSSWAQMSCNQLHPLSRFLVCSFSWPQQHDCPAAAGKSVKKHFNSNDGLGHHRSRWQVSGVTRPPTGLSTTCWTCENKNKPLLHTGSVIIGGASICGPQFTHHSQEDSQGSDALLMGRGGFLNDVCITKLNTEPLDGRAMIFSTDFLVSPVNGRLNGAHILYKRFFIPVGNQVKTAARMLKAILNNSQLGHSRSPNPSWHEIISHTRFPSPDQLTDWWLWEKDRAPPAPRLWI